MAYICNKPHGSCPKCEHYRPDPDYPETGYSCFAAQDEQNKKEDTKMPNKSKGYAITDSMCGMLEIQKIDSMNIFEDDAEAVEQAIKDGIKIIPVDELPENFERRYLGWIDSAENRARIQAYCNKKANTVMREGLRQAIQEIFAKYSVATLKIACKNIMDAGYHGCLNDAYLKESKWDYSLCVKDIIDAVNNAEELWDAMAMLHNKLKSYETLYCPHCGEEVDFDETEYDSEGGTEDWHCPACGWGGRNLMSAPKFAEFMELYDETGADVDPDTLGAN